MKLFIYIYFYLQFIYLIKKISHIQSTYDNVLNNYIAELKKDQCFPSGTPGNPVFAETLYSPKQKRTITTLAKHAPFSSKACLLNFLQAVFICLLLFWGGNASYKRKSSSNWL